MKNDNIVILQDKLDAIRANRKEASAEIVLANKTIGFWNRFKLSNTITEGLQNKIQTEAKHLIKYIETTKDIELEIIKKFANTQMQNMITDLTTNIRDTLEDVISKSSEKTSTLLSEYRNKMLVNIEKVKNDEIYKKYPEEQALEIERLFKEMRKTIANIEETNSALEDRIRDPKNLDRF